MASKQHGNHGGTPRDWPLLRKWKSLMLCLHELFTAVAKFIDLGKIFVSVNDS